MPLVSILGLVSIVVRILMCVCCKFIWAVRFCSVIESHFSFTILILISTAKFMKARTT